MRKAIKLILALAIVIGSFTVFRAEALPPIIDLDQCPTDVTQCAGLTVYGDDPGGNLSGGFVAAGDINGDATDDLIIAAHLADPPGGTDAGKAYVIYGSPGLPANIDLNNTSADLAVYGDDTGDLLGDSVAAGDINGDTTEDLIIAADGASPAGGHEAGELYAFFGGAGLPAIIDLNQCPGDPTQCADLIVFGDDAEDQLGFAEAAGDINGDTIDDLIISANLADGPGTGPPTTCPAGETGDRCDSGETYVFYGGPGLSGMIDLNNPSTNADLTIFGEDPLGGDLSGSSSLAVGDINADTIGDIIIGSQDTDAPGRTDAGKTYVIFGAASLPATIDLATTAADLTVLGDDGGDSLGHGVVAGDVNGDTTDDLIIGAFKADPPGGTDAGKTYVVYGGPGLSATIDLSSTIPDVTILGDDAGDEDGLFVAAADTNGDTTDDLIIGARFGDGSGSGSCADGGIGDRCEAGETYVIFGGPSLPATIDLNNPSTGADLTVFGDDAGDQSGLLVAAGDINGDTTDDSIIGAPFADPTGGADAGEAYVIYSTKPVKVGGYSVDVEPGEVPVETARSSGANAGVLAGVIAGAVTAGAVVLGSAAWYVRRKRAR